MSSFYRKKLEERQKEVQKFYKSESESDNDDDMEITPPSTPPKSTKQVPENNNLDSTNRDDECNTEKLIREIINDVLENCFSHSEIANENYGLTTNNETIQEDSSNFNDENDINIKDNNMDINMVSNLLDEAKCIDRTIHESTNFEINKDSGPSLSLDIGSQFEAASNTCPKEHNQEQMRESITSLLHTKGIDKNSDNDTNVLEDTGDKHNCDSMDFDFTIDDDDDDDNNHAVAKLDCDDSSKQKSVEDQYLDNLLKKYSTAEVSDDLTSSDQNCTSKKLDKQKLLAQFETVKPCLSGGPDQDIDLDEGITKPNEVVRLMERFMQHALTKNVVKNKVQLE